MKRLFFVLLPLLLIGCRTPATLHVINESDYDAYITSGSTTHFILKKSETYIDGDLYAPYQLESNDYPIKLEYSGNLIRIFNNFKIYTLNVKNITSEEIQFEIENNFNEKIFSIDANSEKTISIKVQNPKIKTTHHYYSLNNNNNEFNLCFY